MEKSNPKMKMIVTISIISILILTAVSTVAYSFFVQEMEVDTALNVNTVIIDDNAQYSFKASGVEDLTLDVSTADMQDGVESATEVLAVEFIGGSESQPYICTYDIVWTDTSEDAYVPSANIADNGGKEYTLAITDSLGSTFFEETQISSLTSGNALVSGLEIESTGSLVKQEYNIIATMYFWDTAQNILGKNYSSMIKVDNVVCAPDDPLIITTNSTLANAIVSKGSNNTMSLDNTWGIINENGYRYEGDDPSNYVCFGSEDATCPADNVYRIIGAFNVEYDNNSDGTAETTGYLAKIQKNTIYGGSTMVYHSTYSATTNSHYPNSEIYPILNTTWHDSLSSTYQNQIASVNWNLGAVQQSFTSLSVGDFYTQERGSSMNAGVTEYEKVFKIGMMYASDYGYAVLSENCARTTILYSGYSSTANCYDLNWLHDASHNQWTMTARFHSSRSHGFYVSISGIVTNHDVHGSMAVRPVFYLNSDVKVTGGSGTSDDPYRISL